MPRQGKSRRAAARQGQLGQRKRRQERGPSGFPMTEVAPPSRAGEDGPGIPIAGDAPQPTPQLAAAPRGSASRQATARLTVYNYVGAEVKRILAMAVVAIVVLVAVSFVLK